MTLRDPDLDLRMRIAVLSDTHGLLRPEAIAFLKGADLILHAGDVGKEAILSQLQAIAPLKVVRGNVDTGVWAEKLPIAIDQNFHDGKLRIYMTHIWQDDFLKRVPGSPHVIIVGHSHKPELAIQPDGVLKLNPGSCGPRRFKLPVCAVCIDLNDRHAVIKIQDILDDKVLMEWSGTLHTLPQRHRT